MADITQLKVVTSFPAVVGVVLSSLRRTSEAEVMQSDMASAIGASVSTWSRIETGETALTIEQLEQAARRLGVASSAILLLAEEKMGELEQKGVSIESKRMQFDDVVSRGAIPVIGAALVGLMGPLGVLVATGAVIRAVSKQN